MTDPIWMSVAATLATKAAGTLFDLVKQRFGQHPERAKALAEVSGAAPDPAAVGTLAEALAATEREEPGFGEELRVALTKVDVHSKTDMRNVVSGTVTGTVVQAGEVHGGIHFGR